MTRTRSRQGTEPADAAHLLERLADAVVVIGPDTVVRWANPAAERLMGMPLPDAIGRPALDLVHPDDRHHAILSMQSVLQKDHGTLVETRLRTPDGYRLVELIGARLDGGDVAVSLRDITDRRRYEVAHAQELAERLRVEGELRSACSLLEATLESTADGILVVDHEGRVTDANRRLFELWRLPPELAEELGDADVARDVFARVRTQLVDPDAVTAAVRNLAQRPEAESHDTIELTDGRVFERCSVPQRVDGRVVGRVWSFRDRTEHKLLESELRYRANHDQLTGLANKAKFCDLLAHAVHRSERNGTGYAVLFLDVDNFKTVNDSLGHQAGDELLVAAAALLSTCLRATDTPARLGGDEFAVLVEDVQDDEASQLARRICDAYRAPFRLSGQNVFATVSVGIAFGDADTTSEQILRNADLAMYMAKARGKNRYETFEARQHDAAVARVQVEADLHQALDADEFVLFYQPIVDASSGAIGAAEALVRWEHPTRGLLLPGIFIPLAEECGLMDVLSRQLLERACTETLAMGRADGDRLRVSVNVSPAQLTSEHFVGTVAEVLALTGLDPHRLILEITETAMVQDAALAERYLRALKDLGVTLALDDFGTGFSSLTFLQQFPIDIVKIDKSFVAELEDTGGRPSLAPAVVTLAHSLGLPTVAEGIETPRQLARLRDLGCDYLQGFLLHRPRAPEILAEILSGEPEAFPSLIAAVA